MQKLCLLLLFSFLSAQAQSPFFVGRAIFALQEKHVHGSSIVECLNGDLLACWFHGSGERTANDVQVQGARWRKGANQWGPVFLMADTPGFPDCNPVLYIDRRNRLWLFWVTVLANQWQNSLLKYRLSEDYQKAEAPVWQWQEVISLNPGDRFAETVRQGFKELGRDEPMWAEYALPYERMLIEASRDPFKRQIGWMTRIHPLTLADGRLLLPLYSDGFNLSLIALSDDDGATWQASAPIVGYGLNQPSLVQKQDGSLIAYMRDDGDPPKRVLISTSTDRGESWTIARDSDIPNPGSSLEVIKLHSGNWLMVYNDTEEGRHSLCAALSDDEGRSWRWHRSVAASPKNEKSFSYPSVLQRRSGMIDVTFSYAADHQETIRHVSFNEAWVKADQH